MKKILLLITTAIVVLLSSCSDDVELTPYEGNFPNIIGSWICDSIAGVDFADNESQNSYDTGDSILNYNHVSLWNDGIPEVTFTFCTDYSLTDDYGWDATWAESDSIIHMYYLSSENVNLTFDWRLLKLTEDFMVLEFDEAYYFYHKQ